MDAGQIHSTELFIANIICRFPRRGCANIIEIVDQMNHETLSEIVAKILKELYAKGIKNFYDYMRWRKMSS
jgi:hypothetical protein